MSPPREGGAWAHSRHCWRRTAHSLPHCTWVAALRLSGRLHPPRVALGWQAGAVATRWPPGRAPCGRGWCAGSGSPSSPPSWGVVGKRMSRAPQTARSSNWHLSTVGGAGAGVGGLPAGGRTPGSTAGAHPRLPALEVRRRSRERWRPWARRSASCLCFSSSSLVRTSSSPHTSEEKWVSPVPFHPPSTAGGGSPGSPRGVSSIRDFPFRSAPCATSSSTRCT